MRDYQLFYLYSYPELAYTLVRKGILPAYKKGKKLYFYEDELLAWVENGRKKTSEQNYDEVLANMQNGMRHKPKRRTNF